MEKKSTVGKSKSSNSAIISRIDRGDKKSSSNNEIKPLLKKRGVYVEKTLKPDAYRVSQKPPKRPRSKQKKFLASVLSIVSEMTAGTQYPERDNSDSLKLRSKPKTDTHKSRKTKYKSRVLNNEQKQDEEIIILKSKKNRISHSPSTFSDKSKDGFKWSEFLQNEPNKNSIKLVLENNIYSGVTEGAAKDVLKSSKCKKKLRIQDEFTSEIDTDKKIYNFFVDLLETTFNIYNVEAGINCEMTDSKTRLEVDESVAQKFVIKNESLSNDHKIYHTNEMDTEKNLFLNSFMDKPLDVKISEQKPSKDRPKITKSYPFTKNLNSIKSKSFDVSKETSTRKEKKELLDILKEQLTQDVFSFEEPQNLYQSLKIMAKNKKKSRKAIRYKENNKFQGFDERECMFRRKVLFKSKKKSRKPDPKTPTLVSRSFQMNNNNPYSSYHSLEIYSYDREEPGKRYNIPKPKPNKHNIGFEIHSPSSISESDLYCSTVEFGEVAV